MCVEYVISAAMSNTYNIPYIRISFHSQNFLISLLCVMCSIWMYVAYIKISTLLSAPELSVVGPLMDGSRAFSTMNLLMSMCVFDAVSQSSQFSHIKCLLPFPPSISIFLFFSFTSTLSHSFSRFCSWYWSEIVFLSISLWSSRVELAPINGNGKMTHSNPPTDFVLYLSYQKYADHPFRMFDINIFTNLKIPLPSVFQKLLMMVDDPNWAE